jgi:hypothetical protein
LECLGNSLFVVKTQKSVAFLYTNNEQAKKKVRETIPFTIASKIFFVSFIYLETRSQCVSQAGHELSRLLSQFPKCWDHKGVLPCLAIKYNFKPGAFGSCCQSSLLGGLKWGGGG